MLRVHNCADRSWLVRDRLSRGDGVEESLRGFRAHRHVESCPVIAAVQQMAVTGYVAGRWPSSLFPGRSRTEKEEQAAKVGSSKIIGFCPLTQGVTIPKGESWGESLAVVGELSAI